MGPLSGLKMIEIVGIGPCPFAAMMLSDLGAEILRVDRAGTKAFAYADPKTDFLARGRKSIELDLKSEAGRGLLLQLVERADVLLEGFRPGVMERLGVGPETCLERNPGLVYGRMTGWGPSSARKAKTCCQSKALAAPEPPPRGGRYAPTPRFGRNLFRMSDRQAFSVAPGPG